VGAFLGYVILMLLEPGVIGQVMAGEIGGEKIGQDLLLMLALVLLTPLSMAFLTLILKGSVNRWANIVAAVAVMVFELVVLIDDLAQPQPYAYAILFGLVKVVVLALIIWYAWKSKQKA